MQQDEIIVRSNRTNARILRRLSRDRAAQQRKVNSLTGQQHNLVDTVARLGAKGAEAVKDKLEDVRSHLDAAQEELERIRLETEQIRSRTLNAEVMAATLERFSQILEGAEPPELQRLLPTIIKGGEWTEDAKTSEGVLEVYLWGEAQAAFGDGASLGNVRTAEPLAVNGSPEGQDWLPESNPLRNHRTLWHRQAAGSWRSRQMS